MLQIVQQAHLQALKQAALFTSFTAAELKKLGYCCQYKTIPAHTHLFYQQESCSAFYFLLDGFIELYRKNNEEAKKTVEFIEAGQTFAEAAMFSGEGYPVCAVALIESEVLAINSLKFSKLLQQHATLNWKMLHTLSYRLHHLVGQVAASSLLNAEQRVISYLLQHTDEEDPASAVSHLPNRRAELASCLGLSVETLCRILSRLKKQGLIETRQSSQIRVLETQRLRDLLAVA